jgi:hypothetical protein
MLDSIEEKVLKNYNNRIHIKFKKRSKNITKMVAPNFPNNVAQKFENTNR